MLIRLGVRFPVTLGFLLAVAGLAPSARADLVFGSFQGLVSNIYVYGTASPDTATLLGSPFRTSFSYDTSVTGYTQQIGGGFITEYLLPPSINSNLFNIQIQNRVWSATGMGIVLANNYPVTYSTSQGDISTTQDSFLTNSHTPSSQFLSFPELLDSGYIVTSLYSIPPSNLLSSTTLPTTSSDINTVSSSNPIPGSGTNPAGSVDIYTASSDGYFQIIGTVDLSSIRLERFAAAPTTPPPMVKNRLPDGILLGFSAATFGGSVVALAGAIPTAGITTLGTVIELVNLGLLTFKTGLLLDPFDALYTERVQPAFWSLPRVPIDQTLPQGLAEQANTAIDHAEFAIGYFDAAYTSLNRFQSARQMADEGAAILQYLAVQDYLALGSLEMTSYASILTDIANQVAGTEFDVSIDIGQAQQFYNEIAVAGLDALPPLERDVFNEFLTDPTLRQILLDELLGVDLALVPPTVSAALRGSAEGLSQLSGLYAIESTPVPEPPTGGIFIICLLTLVMMGRGTPTRTATQRRKRR